MVRKRGAKAKGKGKGKTKAEVRKEEETEEEEEVVREEKDTSRCRSPSPSLDQVCIYMCMCSVYATAEKICEWWWWSIFVFVICRRCELQEQLEVEMELRLLEALEIYPPAKLKGEFRLSFCLLFSPFSIAERFSSLTFRVFFFPRLIFIMLWLIVLEWIVRDCNLILNRTWFSCRNSSSFCTLWLNSIYAKKVSLTIFFLLFVPFPHTT